LWIASQVGGSKMTGDRSAASNPPLLPTTLTPAMRTYFLRMQTFLIEDLLEIAQAQVEIVQSKRYEELIEKDQDGLITADERQELENLRIAADQLMLRKAYAWAVLKWRGYRLPALQELVVPL
jgi:hypothetical protein